MKKSKQRGFTLAELMGVVAIFGILAALAVFFIKRAVSTDFGNAQTEAARQAAAWASHNVGAGAHVECATAASGKRYMVPCSVSLPRDGGLPAIWGLECGGGLYSAQEGCRVTSSPLVGQ